MSCDATKERELWLKLILWMQAEARGEHQDIINASSVWPFQAQRWLTSRNPVIVREFLLVCEYAGIEKEAALQLRKQMRELYGTTGGRGWRIARDQDRGGK